MGGRNGRRSYDLRTNRTGPSLNVTLTIREGLELGPQPPKAANNNRLMPPRRLVANAGLMSRC